MKKRRSKFKHLECIAFDPPFEVTAKSPLKKDEVVLFLGNIPNVPGHCAVARFCGEVVWLMHPEDFRKCKDEEL